MTLHRLLRRCGEQGDRRDVWTDILWRDRPTDGDQNRVGANLETPPITDTEPLQDSRGKYEPHDSMAETLTEFNSIILHRSTLTAYYSNNR